MSRFLDYVTNVGFRLELSKSQISAIAALAKNTDATLTLMSAERQTLESLVRKGLIEYVDREFRLTSEGKLVVPLLRAANLLDVETIRRSKLPTKAELERSIEE